MPSNLTAFPFSDDDALLGVSLKVAISGILSANSLNYTPFIYQINEQGAAPKTAPTDY